MARTHRNVTPEQFVRAYQAATCLKDVMEATGLTLSAVTNRAVYYKKKGIPLRAFYGQDRKHMDVTALRELAKSLAPKPNTEGPGG